jgi:hypothetical protein
MGPSRRAGWVPVSFGVIVVALKKVTVYVAQVDQLNFWWLRAEVEGSDFDRSDEGWPSSGLELPVEDTDKRRCEQVVEPVPIEVNGHIATKPRGEHRDLSSIITEK